MKLQECSWTCECGTTIRYANTHRIGVHIDSKKHQQFLIHKTVFVQRYVQRTRKPDEMVVTRGVEPVVERAVTLRVEQAVTLRVEQMEQGQV